jgi:hypothetical protein
MSRLKVMARLMTGAASAVALSVVTSQVLTDGELHPSWLYLSVAVAVMSGMYGEVFGPDAPLAPRPGAAAVRLPARGRRGVYLRQLRETVRRMETVGVATQGEFVLAMKQTYVDLTLAPQPPHHTANEPYIGRARVSPGERRALSSFLRADSQVLAVIGGPGSGKTTLMRSTALELCHRGLRRRRLPILLYLRDHANVILTDELRTLAVVAAKAGWVEGKIPPSWIEHRLDKGRCLVMLDGLDELADDEDRLSVVAWVKRQIERYPRNDYVVTSRPHGYLSNPLPNANVLQVRRFTDAQISLFLHNWYYAIECRALGTTGKQVRVQAIAKADDLLRRLHSRPSLHDLAANPLFLTMIANVHRYRDALPGSRAALYAEMCQVLVHRRQEAKRLTNQTGLRGPQKEHIMQSLALKMMCERIRDIPIADAREAIESDLRGASRDVSASDFLSEVRKSGLLVEREHGRYAFVHFTLQEYLAAAHLGDKEVGLLTDGVDDPWWRETTLLWAANSDATPIVAACLTSSSVQALSLAFDCAMEARTLEPNMRDKLDALLASQPDDDLNRQWLIAGVKATRSLREMIWLNEDTAICAHPISQDLYAAFIRAAGRNIPKDTTADATSTAGDDRAATGMWASDAVRFVAWLNNLVDDRTRYRLPTAAELDDSVMDLAASNRHTIWMQTRTGPQLYQPPGAVWPYAPDPIRLGHYIAADREHALPYLSLVLGRPIAMNVQDFDDVFTRALARALHTNSPPDLSLLNLALARDLARAAILSIPLSQVIGRDDALARTLDRARVIARAINIDLSIGSDIGIALDIALARDLARVLDRDVDRALDRDVDRALQHALDRARALDRDHDLDVARDRDLAHDLAHDLDLDLDRVRSDDGDLDTAFSLTGDLASDLVHALAQGGGQGPYSVSTFARDLALDLRILVPDGRLRQSVAAAFRILLRQWALVRSRESKRGETPSTFDGYLATIPAETPVPRIRRLPAVALRQARELLDARPANLAGARGQASRLLNHVRTLISPILDGPAPLDDMTLSYARIQLLAAAALLRDGHDDQDAAIPVIEAVRGLVAFQERREGHLTPNEVLVLVRT